MNPNYRIGSGALAIIAKVWTGAVAMLLLLGASTFPQQLKAPTINQLPPGELLNPQRRELLPQGVTLRSVYPPGIAVTKLSEKWVPYLYNDAVLYCTIGYGHLIKKFPCDGTEAAEFLHGLTKPRGEEILTEDMASSQYSVMSLVVVSLTDGQFASLTDFVFNVGTANFRNSTLLQVVNTKQEGRVPAQLRRWIMAKGKPLPGLKVRREREITLFFEGIPNTRAIPRAEENVSPIDINEGERRIVH